ncbi:DUF1800 domain-containing protein [Actinocrispum wychmicini]|uniref:Uncharacterized protein (DUF1800 family) n=1 Tax=Actinocrispum wychmicini TaxID=1213861 RepID=A0A4R2JNB3_9PSEU|nr:DUF1800 domain-containing protein [Actinocrispum wychmicini]TCO60437.1 uncharacterized protein (DUF1800 family) [Actinocrispum wychmicini]
MAVIGDRAAARRLFERFGFGPRPGELDSGRTVDAFLSAADDPGAPPPPTLGPEPKPGKDKAAKQQEAQQVRTDQQAITLWWLDRMVATNSPLVERMTWFWHGHFATSAQKVKSARMMLAQNQTQRQHALGDFGVLANAMVVDPAMLVWLDGQKNTAKAANENLGRELMELFTLGVGNYTEDDVRAAARALTGWKIDRDTLAVTLVPKQHDNKDKTVIGHTGPLDAHSLVDVLVTSPASPKFVARRLWQRLVSGTPPADDVLARLTGAYGPNRDIRALLRALAAEPAFRDDGSTIVKQPVEWAVGVMRAFKIRPATLPADEQTKLLAGLRGMGQVPFLPPSVGGWPAGGAWLTTAAGLARLQLARLLTPHADLAALSGDPVTAIGTLLGVGAWSDRTRAALTPLAHQPAQLASVAVCAPEYVIS